MKTLLIVSALFLSCHVFSQDSIITRSGQVIAAKVNEVTQTEVKYRKPTNPDGPLYVISKNDVVVIEYKNGTKDVFQATAPVNNSNANNNNTNSQSQQQTQQQAPQQNYGYAAPRPNVNVVIAPPVIGFGGYYPYGGGGYGYGYGGGFYRPFPRFYGGYGYGGGYGGYHHCHHW